ncbi:MAG TPA: hypothetical protein VGD64_13880 [Acidisarcina sp.]
MARRFGRQQHSLDIALQDPDWSEWSQTALAKCAEHSTLIINPIVYAEVSVNIPPSNPSMVLCPATSTGGRPSHGREASFQANAF